MDERDRAREKLARAVKAEMEHAPLDKITVTQIVERAGLTRQTFYRNFVCIFSCLISPDSFEHSL